MRLRSSLTLILAVGTTTILLSGAAAAQPLGMVADTSGTVTVFDDATGTPVGSVAVGGSFTTGDCSIQGTTGFVTDFAFQVWVIDLTGPALAPGPNPIPISNFGEDTSISPDSQYLVVCDGSALQPVSVVDIATQTEISTFALGHDCNSVDVCSDGSVLVTSSNTSQVRRLSIDGAGNLTDTGDSLVAGGEPNNVVCGPGATSGVVVTRSTATAESFTIPGLAPVSFQPLSGSFGISAAIDAAGSALFVRSNSGAVDAYAYSDATGVIGGALYPAIPIVSTPTFFGMDQMALNPANTKLYVSQPGGVDFFDPATGGFLGTVVDPNISQPTGICFGGDSDGDGVPDGADLCPGTVIPESVPTIQLGVNRWALVDGDTSFDTTPPPGVGPNLSFTVDDTSGCSCEQIIAAQGLGQGHTKFGCSISAMQDWIALAQGSSTASLGGGKSRSLVRAEGPSDRVSKKKRLKSRLRKGSKVRLPRSR